jgi:hypothetical protein
LSCNEYLGEVLDRLFADGASFVLLQLVEALFTHAEMLARFEDYRSNGGFGDCT